MKLGKVQSHLATKAELSHTGRSLAYRNEGPVPGKRGNRTSGSHMSCKSIASVTLLRGLSDEPTALEP